MVALRLDAGLWGTRGVIEAAYIGILPKRERGHNAGEFVVAELAVGGGGSK
jgi:hypothetical protein